ncbi:MULTISPECIES: helix-turn-helix domain-containing protein [Streptomyces]|uniref:Helix-turn-helix domain-containing protein n=2 Tax=Streptomyces TaxID=1883 RepID=A0A3R7IQ77_9ACTN|nr:MULTISPECIES: helix-turn-helix transcriptional regulator [Streptomyces]KNE79733.1 XRE family transcriptional regulator [Streptomyces fradiae]OFA34213.1 transcriptional regulator [Streptomyces fradiae]PQM21347.1 helix-turn-helix domain-containing protein [Streptomyces xinghaiensis]RKM93714.1 helix-turn-helix domain-containing protein [Streptomyces xinghaiensis]RNC71481.1 helix-turn-helix domain-containing protein [Streptomyces xinghaiensis]
MARVRSMSTPTVRLVILGKRLKDLRTAAGKSYGDAAKVLGVSELTIRRMEKGEVGLKIPYVRNLLTEYGVSGQQEIDDFLALVEAANRPGWWHRYRDALPPWFKTYVALEEEAGVIRAYEPNFIPGLLQTEEYARTVLRAGLGRGAEEEAERRVAFRMERQKLLARPDAPRLWVIMDETVLRRPIAPPEVMRAQIEHLVEVSEAPNIALQLMPFALGLHPAMYGPFHIFRFPQPELQDIVYLENLIGAVYLDEYDDVSAFTEVMDRMGAQALPVRRTAAALDAMRKEI